MYKKLVFRLEDNRRKGARKAFLDLLETYPSAKVLDCGCGSGDFSIECAQKIGTSSICGVETTEKLAQLAEQNGIRIYRQDLNNLLSIENDAFDVILASQVIEHLYKTDTFIKEIYRILRPGGYLVISTPNLATIQNIIFLILGLQPFNTSVSAQVYLGNPLHPRYHKESLLQPLGILRTFTYSGLKELLEYHGFKVEKAMGIGYFPFPGGVGNILARLDAKHSMALIMKARKV